MSAEVTLATVSLTWRDAASAARDRAATPIDAPTWAALGKQGAVGLVELHTCARSLWIFETGGAPGWVGNLWQAQVARRTGVTPAMRHGADALRFALRVSVGLDSYQQGEADVGRQFAGAVAEARDAGRLGPILRSVAQQASQLGDRGVDEGWVRANRGLGALAVDVLREHGLTPGADLAIIGAGAIAQRVAASMQRAGFDPPVLYNRSPKPGTVPLDQLRRHAGVVVCTAGPERWLRVDAGVVVDLGMPPQVAGEAIGLDRLLTGAGFRLPEATMELAEAAVDEAVARIVAEVEARRWRRRLGEVREVRDRFLDDELEKLLHDALDPLPAADRLRVLDAARAAVRRYDHEVVTMLRDLHPSSESP